MKTQFLFCPGPVNVALNVKEAALNCEIGHREEEFSTMFKRLKKKILDLFQIRNKKNYHAVVVTGSGTAANETVLSSIVGDKHILILTNGEFGERLLATSKIHNKHTHSLSWKWAEQLDLAKVEKYLQKKQIDIIAFVHHETSTGMMNPIQKLGELAKRYNAQVFVDGVSSIGAEKIDMEKWNITFCSTSASKAIASLPGLSIVVAEKKALEALKDIKVKVGYLNLFKFYSFSKKHSETPNTPAVQLFYALETAVDNILRVGVDQHSKSIARKANQMRRGMEDLGLEFILPESEMSSVLTSVKIPKYVNAKILKKKLKEKNMVVYNGKGPFMNKAFQVGNIGELTSEEIYNFLQELGSILFNSRSEVRITRYQELESPFFQNLQQEQFVSSRYEK